MSILNGDTVEGRDVTEAIREFRREYLLRLPLPLAQLYGRAHNAKSPRERHDNTFYLFEAATKLLAITAAAHYLEEVTTGGRPRVPALDRMLAQLALPSLGQWVGMLRELTKHVASRVDRDTHPWGELAQWLHAPRRDCPGLLQLYRRTKHGPDGAAAGDTQVSWLSGLESLVQYRNGVFGHGAGRFDSFYSQEMGPLLFPAVNELLAEPVLCSLGPRGAKLVQITEIRARDEGLSVVDLRELVGMQSERMSPLVLPSGLAARLLPHRVALLWPGREFPLRLDPLLQFRESDLTEEVLFLNRDRNGRQVEYLSYTTGRTERDRSMLPELAKLLSQVTDRTVGEEDLRRLAEQTFSETPSVEGLFGEAPAAPVQLGEYDVLAELGRGGMGVVYLARQRSLGRLVALKMLPGDLSGDEVALARFRREIRHLARCDDPHIVKVLASGVFPDGRAYYTMEYVQGSDLEMVWRELSGTSPTSSVTALGNSTWSQAVLSASRKQRSKTEASSRGSGSGRGITSDATRVGPGGQAADPAAEPILPPIALPPLPELPEAGDDPGGFIRRVVTLARDAAAALQTVHDQGIVHRDIKPANLMLTPDGSRLVLMDFGLAKGDSQSLAASRQGGLLGTLRYAAPEQLAAANIKIGPAADVRALGVTLWELLTRRRLFGEAADEAGLAQEVLTSDVPRLRSVDPRFDRDLEAIVARATERRATDRISTAGKLAELLQLWLDGRPLPIRPPGVGELGWRWMREHRAVVAVAGVALVSITTAIGVAFAHVAAARDAAEAALARANRQGELSLETLRAVIYDIDNQAADRPSLRNLRRALLEQAQKGLDKLSQDLPNDSRLDRGQLEVRLKLGRMFAQIGNAEGLSGLTQAQRQFQAMEEQVGQILRSRPDDYWALRYRALALSELAKIQQQTGDLAGALKVMDQAREIEEDLVARSVDDPQMSRNLAATYSWLGAMQLTAGKLVPARDFLEKDLKIAEECVRLEPQNGARYAELAITYQTLGNIAGQSGRLSESIEYLNKSLESASRAVELGAAEEGAPIFAFAHNRLGHACVAAGDLEQAEQHFRESQTLLKVLAERDPGGISSRFELGKSYGALGDLFFTRGELPAAIEAYQEYQRLLESLLALEPRHSEIRLCLAVALSSLGNVSLNTNQLQVAQDYFAQASAGLEALLTDDPLNTEVRERLGESYRASGEALMLVADVAGAIRQFDQGLEHVQKILEVDPANASARRMVAVIHNWIGNANLRTGDYDEVSKHFQASLATFETLVQADPDNAELRIQLSKAHAAMGDLRSEQGAHAEALAAYGEARRISQDLLEGQPRNNELRLSLASILRAMGSVRKRSGELDEAAGLLEEATNVLDALAREQPENLSVWGDFAAAVRSQGEIKYGAGDFADALPRFRRAEEILTPLVVQHPRNVQLKTNLALALNWMGNAELRLKELETARAHLTHSTKLYEELLAVDPTNPHLKIELATSHQPLGELEQSASHLDAALEHYHKSRELLREVVDQNPTHQAASRNLKTAEQFLCTALAQRAVVAERLKDFAAALKDRDAVLKMAPELADSWNLRGNAYFAMENWEAARNDYSQAIERGDPVGVFFRNRATSHLKLGDAVSALSDINEALRIAPMNEDFQKLRAEILGLEPSPPPKSPPAAADESGAIAPPP